MFTVEFEDEQIPVALTKDQHLYLSMLISELARLRADVYTRQGDFNEIKQNIEIEGLREIMRIWL